jgi:uncharacterized protein involved in exopolysaccharide biosynthesis/Mrp family chromosome partitioning ATPase
MIKHDPSVPANSSSARRHPLENGMALAPQSSDTFGLSDIWALFKRRKRLIGSIVLASTLLAVLVGFIAPKSYTVTSEVVLERKDTRPFATDASLQSLDRDKSAAETEMDILESRQFAGRIVDKLNLVNDPDYNPSLSVVDKPGENSVNIFGYVAGLLKSSASKRTPPTELVQRDRAITLLLSQYSVGRTGESLAVRITVSNQTAQLAADIANTIANLYVESSLEFKKDERVADKNRALTTGGTAGFLRQGLAQPLLVTLRTEEAKLQQKRDELASKLGKNHPEIVETNSQIASVHNMIEVEVQRILLDLEAESLKPSARILSSAEVPTSPSFPKPGIIIPAAFVGSSLLAFLVAMLLEVTDKKIRSGKRVSQLLQIPNLGYVPEMPKRQSTSETKVPTFLAKRLNLNSSDAERSVYMASRYSDVSKPNSVLMITSCTYDSAGASMAWGIAAAAAADGRSTVFIDLDFSGNIPGKKPGVSRPSTLLESYLRDETFLVEVIQRIPSMPRLSFIDATGVLCEPSRPLNSKKLHELLTAIKKSGYDFIVLHAPPVLFAGDANWLSPFVDGVILAVSWGKTTEEQLLDAASQLSMNRAPLIGTVIDQVNPSIHANYEYGGSVLASTPTLLGNLRQISTKDVIRS